MNEHKGFLMTGAAIALLVAAILVVSLEHELAELVSSQEEVMRRVAAKEVTLTIAQLLRSFKTENADLLKLGEGEASALVYLNGELKVVVQIKRVAYERGGVELLTLVNFVDKGKVIEAIEEELLVQDIR